jgi:hypothetical protein
VSTLYWLEHGTQACVIHSRVCKGDQEQCAVAMCAELRQLRLSVEGLLRWLPALLLHCMSRGHCET